MRFKFQNLFRLILNKLYFNCQIYLFFFKNTVIKLNNLSSFSKTINIIFILIIATKSFRELFGIPEFDLGFNTNIPNIIFTYGAMLYCLNYFVPKVKFIKKQ